MRVVFLSSLVGLGGGETNLVSLISHLQKNSSVECTLITSGLGPINNLAKDLGVETISIPNLRMRSGSLPYFSISAYRKLKKSVNVVKPNLVHANDWETLFYTVLLKVLSGSEYKILWTCHGWWNPKVWPITWTYKKSDATVCVSKFVADKFFGGSNAWIKNLSVIPLGVDTERFSPRATNSNLRKSLGINEQDVSIGVIGRLQDVKGHLKLLRAAVDIDYSFKIVFVGDNTFNRKEDERSIKAIEDFLTKNDELAKKVIWTGFREDVEDVMAALDIVVCPSDFESFGLVNIEAMASGKPVISTHLGGPAEVIKDGENGLLFDSGSVDSLREKLIVLLGDKKMREQLGEKARDSVLDNFSLDKQAERIVKVYKKISSQA